MRIVLSSNISVWTVFYFILKQIAGTELDFGGIGIEPNFFRINKFPHNS